MAQCPVCSTELKFGNTPIFNAGKMTSGETICLDCFRKLTKNNVGARPKHMTIDQLKEKISGVKEQKAQDRIKTQLERLEIDKSTALKFFGRKELNELPKILTEDEEIFELVVGRYNERIGILVGTDKRLLFIEKGLLFGLKVEDFGLDKITSIQYESGLIFATIKIMASGNVAAITDVDKAQARTFSEKARLKLNEPKANNVTVIQSHVDVAEQIEKLSKLKDQGILTQDEFESQKKKLLGL